jgi:nucleoside-diphosphate-sugar epimerase
MLLITGATGHTGQWLIKSFSKAQYSEKIRCSVQRTTDLRSLVESNLDIEYIEGDFREPEFAMKALEGVQTVIHLVGISCSKNIIKACQANKVEWAIMVHTTGRFSKFKLASQDYIETEDMVLNSGVKTTILRPTMIYGGPRDRNIWKILNFMSRFRFFPVFGNGKNLLQPIMAKDLGEAIFLAFNHRNRTFGNQYNLAGKEPISYVDLIRTIARKLNKRVVVFKVPLLFCLLTAKIIEFLFKSPPITYEQVLRMKEDKSFDYSEAARDFGFSPRSFEEGIQEEIVIFLKAPLL